jgi:hypothetical protein
MVTVASAMQGDIGLAQLILFAAGIPYVTITDPLDHTFQLLVDRADAQDAASTLA